MSSAVIICRRSAQASRSTRYVRSFVTSLPLVRLLSLPRVDLVFNTVVDLKDGGDPRLPGPLHFSLFPSFLTLTHL